MSFVLLLLLFSFGFYFSYGHIFLSLSFTVCYIAIEPACNEGCSL